MKATASNQNIVWFNHRFQEGALELSPEFQRNPVWQQPQKDYLIETILLNLPVPEIYYVTNIKPDGKTVYTVVDGQQRLRTIIEFVNNEFELKNTATGFPRIFKFNDLSDPEKQRIWRYPLVVRDLEESTENDVRDLFQRLNKYSFVLNAQELRNARFKGDFLKLVQNISDHEFWTASGLFSANDIRRMLDLEYISILLASLIGGIFNRKERVDEFYIMYEEEFEESSYYKSYFIDIIDIIDSLFENIRKTKWKNKVNFYTLFLCLDSLDVKKNDIETIGKLSDGLTIFIENIEKVKQAPDDANANDTQYFDAATYGTNDKEKRVRRHNLLMEYLEEILADQ